jgi:hypothetical protein
MRCSATIACVTPVLITDTREDAMPRARRATLRERVRARLAPRRLDILLANGAAADSRGDLALRAFALISLRTRQRLAGELDRVIEDARCLPTQRPVRMRRREVLRNAPLLRETARRLQVAGPVDARGVAQIRRLLRDGAGPLYSDDCIEDLRGALRRALDALEPTPTGPFATH